MAKTFKEVLDISKIKQIANDARALLCEMQNSSIYWKEALESGLANYSTTHSKLDSSTCWKETLKSGLANYSTTHSKLEYLAFKAALSLNICWAIGEYFFEVILTPFDTLVQQIGDYDTTVEEYPFRMFKTELI